MLISLQFLDTLGAIEDLKNFHTDPSDPEQKDVFIGFNKKSVFIFSPQNSGDFKSIHR